MKVTFYLGIGLTLCLCIFFGERPLPPSKLMNYVKDPDHGLHKTRQIGPLKVDLQYQPTSVVIANELRQDEIDRAQYEERAQKLEGLQHYLLRLSVDEPGSNISNYAIEHAQEEQERLYYFSFLMKNDIRLVDGRDTLAPVLYHFERSYDLADHRTFVLAFERRDQDDEKTKTFIIEPEYFLTGPIKMKIKAEDINKVPSLKLL